MAAHAREGDEPGAVRWMLMEAATAARPSPSPDSIRGDDPTWLDATTPVIADDTLYVSLTAEHGWQIAIFEQARLTRLVSVLDRLGVERQLARVTQGLPLQDEAVERGPAGAKCSNSARRALRHRATDAGSVPGAGDPGPPSTAAWPSAPRGSASRAESSV